MIGDSLLAGRGIFAEELGDASHILSTATNRYVRAFYMCMFELACWLWCVAVVVMF
jgi:hypothetical protein